MTSNQLHILIVEDSVEDREMYRRLLERSCPQSYQFTQTDTAEEALAICRSERPDCILLDYNLPDVDGLEFLERLQEGPSRHLPAVVMLTGQGNESVAVEAMKRGAQDYLVKGTLTDRDLKRAVDNAIEKVALVTELEQQRRALERSNRDLEQFAYVTSHDLKEPLRMVSSFADLLGQTYKGQLDEQADKYIHYITDGAKRMQELIDDLLLYSRVGRTETTLEPVSLKDTVDRILDDLQLIIEEAGARVEVGPLPVIMGNRLWIRQLLQNLISNALKFRRDVPPVVTICAEQRQGYWQVSVEDNGIGIDRQYQERIFAVFQRLHSRTEYAGTGIGLAICKKIVEHLGGQIWVESQPDQGTVFSFTLPDEPASKVQQFEVLNA